MRSILRSTYILFFFNDTATTEIYTLSLHDALPICAGSRRPAAPPAPYYRPCLIVLDRGHARVPGGTGGGRGDRESTRLNSSHAKISYGVFFLKKKKHHK